jgi:hypothetical protein
MYGSDRKAALQAGAESYVASQARRDAGCLDVNSGLGSAFSVFPERAQRGFVACWELINSDIKTQ